MDEIFVGKGAQNCDGSLDSFSFIQHILWEDGMPDKCEEPQKLFNMITLGFEPDFDVDYKI